MHNKNVWLCLLALCFIFVSGCSHSDDSPGSRLTKVNDFVIAGSGHCIPITAKLAEYYNNKYGGAIKIPGSIGSSGAIRAVRQGAVDLGLTARPLTEEEKEEGLREIPYARTATVIGVHPTVPDDNITYSDLVAIFAGKKTKWNNGATIIVLSREAGDNTNAVLSEKVPGFAEVLTNSLKNEMWTVYFTSHEETDAIAKTPFSIGFTDIASIKAQSLGIKPLKVNGIEPTIDNICNGSYQLFNDLYFIHKAPLSNRAQGFLNFVFSAEGKTIIMEYGGLPLKGK